MVTEKVWGKNELPCKFSSFKPSWKIYMAFVNSYYLVLRKFVNGTLLSHSFTKILDLKKIHSSLSLAFFLAGEAICESFLVSILILLSTKFMMLWILVGYLSVSLWSWHCSLSNSILMFVIFQLLCIKFSSVKSVFNISIRNWVTLTLKCHPNLEFGVDDSRFGCNSFSYFKALLTLKSINTMKTSLVMLVFYVLLKSLLIEDLLRLI